MEKSKRKYRSLVKSTTIETFLRHFEGWKKIIEPLGVAAFTVVCSIMALYFSKGNIEMSDFGIIAVSVVGGPLLWAIFVLIINYVQAPFIIFRQITKISSYDVEIKPYCPPAKSIQRPGLLVENNKDVAIENCRCSLVYFQIDKIVPDFQLPYCLAWIKNDKLVWGSIDVAPGERKLVAIQTWDRLPKGIVVHFKPINEDRDYGPATGIEIGERGGLAIYRDRYYKVGFCLEFTVEGNPIKSPTELFELHYDGENIKFTPVK